MVKRGSGQDTRVVGEMRVVLVCCSLVSGLKLSVERVWLGKDVGVSSVGPCVPHAHAGVRRRSRGESVRGGPGRLRQLLKSSPQQSVRRLPKEDVQQEYHFSSFPKLEVL